MDHKKYTHQITYWIIFFIGVIIIGFLTMKKPDLTYTLTAKQMLEEVLKLEDALTPDSVRSIMEQDSTNTKLIDLSNPNEFIIGHIREALNIPMQDLLGSEALQLFDDTSTTFILYADDQITACAPWMLMKQIGYNNIKVMLGGYDYYVSGARMPEVAAGKCYDEVAKYDYASYFSTSSSSTPAPAVETPKMVVPQRKKKSVVSGGC